MLLQFENKFLDITLIKIILYNSKLSQRIIDFFWASAQK
jgi:hypothetical protein